MEQIINTITNAIKPFYLIIKKMRWNDFRRGMLDIGGMILLVLSLYGAACLPRMLRIPAMLIGLVALIDLLDIMESMLDIVGTTEGMAGARYLGVGEDPQDRHVRYGLAGQGRVYLEPRIPKVSGMGTQSVEIRGSPGSKIVYWPSGGLGLGAANDRLRIDHKRDPLAIRDSALGCGVMMLDERGKGIAMAERGCDNLLYREVTDSGYAGPIGKVKIGDYESPALIGMGSRGEKSRKNGMGGMRTAGSM